MSESDFTQKEIEEEFRKQYDELGLKPPKNSMPNLERELIIDYWRKAHTRLRQELARQLEEKSHYADLDGGDIKVVSLTDAIKIVKGEHD